MRVGISIELYFLGKPLAQYEPLLLRYFPTRAGRFGGQVNRKQMGLKHEKHFKGLDLTVCDTSFQCGKTAEPDVRGCVCMWMTELVVRNIVCFVTSIQYRSEGSWWANPAANKPRSEPGCSTQRAKPVISFAGRRDCFKLLKFAQDFWEFIKGTLQGCYFSLVMSFNFLFGWGTVYVSWDTDCMYAVLLLQKCVSFSGRGGQITFWVFITCYRAAVSSVRRTHCSHLALHGRVDAWQKTVESPCIGTENVIECEVSQV